VRFSATRLTLLLLLVSRLILGEFASAMPDHGAAHFDHATSTQSSGADACPDHAGKHDDNCCKTVCSCPCLHFSALAVPALVTQAALDEARSLLPIIGAMTIHVGRLLRPPA
jgi:hypothetical protein